MTVQCVMLHPKGWGEWVGGYVEVGSSAQEGWGAAFCKVNFEPLLNFKVIKHYTMHTSAT